MQFEKATTHILSRQLLELPDTLGYHSHSHVLDVYKAATEIGEAELISTLEMQLLLTAVCYHDAGFMVSMSDHETHSCSLAREDLPAFEYSESDIDAICGMIMATRVPQQPGNLLEEIICDADLDYLGRDDFFRIGTTLRDELMSAGVIRSEREWNEMQVRFLEAHRYFTPTSIKLRSSGKERNLEHVRKLLAADNL